MLKELLTASTIRALAGDRSFGRGEAYALNGAVIGITTNGGTVYGTVTGTEDYEVKLYAQGARVGWSCTCPFGAEGNFCKHTVALALVWTKVTVPDGVPAPKQVSLEEVRRRLGKLPAKTLADLLMEFVVEDASVREQVIFKTSLPKEEEGASPAKMQELLELALVTDWVKDGRSLRAFAARLRQVVGLIEKLPEKGRGEEAMELCERAIVKLNNMVDVVIPDTRNYEIATCLEKLWEVHLDTCARVKPDKRRLAEWLFARLDDAGTHGVARSATDYGGVLGKEGLAEYERLVDKEIRKDEIVENSGSGKRSYLNRIKERLLRARGDWDELIKQKSKNLAYLTNYEDVADICLEAGRKKEAISWIKKGLAAERGYTPVGMVSKLVDLYIEMGKEKEAMDTAWRVYRKHPGTTSFSVLAETARKLGSWPEWKPRAIAHLRADVEKKAKRKTTSPWSSNDFTRLVEVYLAEGDIDDAWQAAREGGCDEWTWLQLARERGKTHPGDAIPVIRRSALAALEPTGARAYETGIRLLKELRGLMEQTGELESFRRLVDSLLDYYKQRRLFRDMVKKSRLAR